MLGYTALLAHTEGMTFAAAGHLAAALAHAERAPAVEPWLASIQAVMHADSGDHTAAAASLERPAKGANGPVTKTRLSLLAGLDIVASLSWKKATIAARAQHRYADNLATLTPDKQVVPRKVGITRRSA